MKSPRQRNYLVFNSNILKLVLKKYKKQWLMQNYAFRTQLQRDWLMEILLLIKRPDISQKPFRS